MPVVVQFKSPLTGKVQLSAFDGFNMGLSDYGSLTLTDSGVPALRPNVVGTVSVSGSTPCLAIAANGRVNIERIDASGSSFTFYLRAQSSTPVAVEWWSFDVASWAIRNAAVGVLRLKDLTGVETFNSAMWPLRLVGDRTTPKPVVDYAATPGDDLTDLAGGSVPGGRKWAIIQATPGVVMQEWDTDPELGTGYPYYHIAETYRAVARVSGGTYEMGSDLFERNEGGYDDPGVTAITPRGRSRHILVDVTHFPSAGAPGGVVVTGNVNATSRSVTGSGAATVTTSTASVTASATGGVAPYSFEWQRISGSTAVNATGGVTNTAAFSTTSASQAQDTTLAAVWRCRVTDANGVVGYTPEVTFTHVAAAYDVTPDGLNWPNLSFSTTAEYGSDVTGDLTVSGITHPVTVRATISGFSGGAPSATFRAYVNGVQVATMNATSALGYIEATVSSGDTLGFVADALTDAGSRSLAYTVTVTNRTAAGTPTIDTFTVAGSVDTDNSSAPPDYTPDPLGFSSQSGSTASEYLMLFSDWKTVSGITAAITIRATITGITGNIQMRGLYMWRNSGHYQFTDWDLGDFVEMEFTNGQQIAINADANTDDGTRSGAVTFALTNQTTGASLGSYTYSFTVDSDNSSAPADYTLNGFAPANASTSTNAMSTTLGSSTYGVSGINRTVTLRYRITSIWKGGAGIYSDTGDVGLWLNGTNVAWFGGHTVGATMTVDVVNGDSLGIAAWAAIDVGGGPAEVVIGIAIDNLSTGVNDIGSCTVSYTLDADGNGV